MAGADHGGSFFEAIGQSLQSLENRHRVINADVVDAWYDPSPKAVAAITDALPWLLKTSPPLLACGLSEVIAASRGLDKSHVLVGGGSSDLIFMALPRVISKASTVLIPDPTYGEYAHVTGRVVGAKVKRFRLDPSTNFEIAVDDLLMAAVGCDAVILVNPNNPTGTAIPKSQVERLLSRLPERTWLIIDETYVDFLGPFESIERSAVKRPNTILVKSLSKHYALSGARVGYIAAAPQIIEDLAHLSPPWSVSLPAQVAAIHAIADKTYYADRIAETHALREELVAELIRIGGLKPFPSVANFVLIETSSGAQALCGRLAETGIFIRHCGTQSEWMGDDYIRIAVKGSADQEKIVSALRSCLRKTGEQQPLVKGMAPISVE